MEKAISRFAKDALDNVFVVDEQKGADITDAIQSVWAKYKAYDGISLSRLSMLARNRLEQGG